MLKRSLIASFAGLLALVGLTFTGPAASAEPSLAGCSPGEFCAYADYGLQGPLLLDTAGNWSGSVSGVSSVINKGVPYPGADHVQLDYHWPNAPTESVCIHYSPGPGHYVNFGGDVTITRVVWRGEC